MSLRLGQNQFIMVEQRLAANALKANRTYEFLYNGTQYEFVGDIETNIDTKNTTGTTNKTGTKLFLAGGTSQADNGVTYSNSNVYVGTDNALYSNGKKVLNADEKNATISGSLANQIKQLQDSWETFQGTSTLTLADIEQKFADLDAEIDELNTKLNPNTFIPVTPASPDVTIVQGGYIKVGKIVFVSINLRTSVVVSGNIICKGLPIPLINAYVPLSGINTSSGNIPFTYVNQNGELASVTEANKGFVVTGAYICK